jgi:hypothetical protein
MADVGLDSGVPLADCFVEEARTTERQAPIKPGAAETEQLVVPAFGQPNLDLDVRARHGL